MTSAIERSLEHAIRLARRLPHGDYSTVILLVLYELGISPKNDGFVCLKKAVAMFFENPTCNLKDDIYAKISVELDGVEDSRRVEQSIRRSIKEAWCDHDEEAWNIVFFGTKAGTKEKPSNGEFIAGVAWFVELWQGCCKEVAYARK